MQEIAIQTYPIAKNKILDILEENSIYINQYAQQYFQHRDFDAGDPPAHMDLELYTLSELGLTNGAVLAEIIEKAHAAGLCLCHPSTGVFFRLQYTCQPESADCVLSGTHRSPDGAVIVLSKLLEQDDAFPKGLYLRNVGGALWLRGYVCDTTYLWPANTVFAVAKAPETDQ